MPTIAVRALRHLIEIQGRAVGSCRAGQGAVAGSRGAVGTSWAVVHGRAGVPGNNVVWYTVEALWAVITCVFSCLGGVGAIWALLGCRAGFWAVVGYRAHHSIGLCRPCGAVVSLRAVALHRRQTRGGAVAACRAWCAL